VNKTICKSHHEAGQISPRGAPSSCSQTVPHNLELFHTGRYRSAVCGTQQSRDSDKHCPCYSPPLRWGAGEVTVVSSFSCCTGTPLCSVTDSHGGKSLVLSSRSPGCKAVVPLFAVEERGFARGAGLSGSGKKTFVLQDSL